MTLQKKLVQSANDKAQLEALVQDIWPAVYLPLLGAEQVAYMLATYQSLSKIETEIAQGAHYYLVYEGTSLCGYTAYEERETELYLSKLYLSAAARGKGLARDIFNWYEEVAGGKPICLRVNKQNQQAIEVYEHCGFKQVASECTEIGHGYVMDDYVYQRITAI